MKVTVKRCQAVAIWRWDVDDNCCGICRQAFDATCPDCTVPGDGCPPVWGRCNHAFHLHCILKWIGSQTTAHCPMCRREWEFREHGEGTAEGAGAAAAAPPPVAVPP